MIALTTEVNNATPRLANFHHVDRTAQYTSSPTAAGSSTSSAGTPLQTPSGSTNPSVSIHNSFIVFAHLSFTGTGFSTSDSKGYGTHSAVKIPELIAISCHLA
jgi:hypothetical protein